MPRWQGTFPGPGNCWNCPRTLAGFGNIGGQAGLARALVEFTSGDWAAAGETIAREAVHLELSGLGSNLARLRYVEVQILAGRGDFRRAGELLAASEPPGSRRIDHALWRATGAALDVAMARLDTAMPALEELCPQAAAIGWNEVATISHTALVEGHLARGDGAAARRVAIRFSDLAGHTGMPRDRMASGIAQTLALQDAGPAREGLREALENGLVFVAAQARLALGSMGHDAAGNLAASRAAFSAMGATLWRKRVEAAARAQGASLGPGGAGHETSGPLREVERRLVALLGEGLSNRQIAEVLSYSPKTIEAYLTCLYRKTGCNSRVELIVAHGRGGAWVGWARPLTWPASCPGIHRGGRQLRRHSRASSPPR